MHRRTIKYTNFDDEEVVEEHYFNISRAEVIEMEYEREGGLTAWLREIIKTDNTKALMEEFKKFILVTYGIKSPDGKRFLKSDQIRYDFEHSAAYDALFWELFQDEGKLAEFIAAVAPAEAKEALAQAARDEAKVKEEGSIPGSISPPTPPASPPVPQT